MASWYLGKVNYQKEDENGRLKTITESYLVDALSFTEAEAALYKQIVTEAQDFIVSKISRMRLADLFISEDGEKWFKAKVVYYSVDDKLGKEKKVVNYMLLNADGIEEAHERLKENLKDMIIPYTTDAMTLTPILEVFPHEEPEEKEIQLPPNFRPVSEVLAEDIDQDTRI